MGLGVDIKAAIDALSDADKGDMAKCWDEIGKVIEQHMGDYIGFVKFYKGTGIDIPDTRTTQIGDETGDTFSMPGWYVCNGQSGTPDMRDKFVRMESTAGNTGGSDDAIVVSHDHGSLTGYQSASHYHNTVMGSHGHNLKVRDEAAVSDWAAKAIDTNGTFHTVTNGAANTNLGTKSSGNQSASHRHSIASDGVSGTGQNKPAYYSLIVIIKMS